MPWEVDLTNTFRRGYKNLSVEIRKRVDEALLQLIDSDDPRELGSRKIGKWKGAYSYEIGRQFRILYSVRLEKHTIELLDVGTHDIYR